MNDAVTILRESGAMLEGHFLLSSGRHSDRYFQCARLLQYPDRAAAVLAQVADRIKADIHAGKLALDAVVGPAMGGIVVAYELGRQLGLPAFFTERDDTGVMTLRRGFAVEDGTRILIAEDVITTGKSSGESAAVLEALGGSIEAIACLVDRRASGADIPWPLYAAVTMEAVNWDSAGCELCKQGIPFVKPGSRKQFNAI
ncbi:MAG: orotate phosphoribosyltransferase [Treponema sp.]|jgi:orotate phosphoribosyltransferase|nr:orotate phosphoribosyltransferase [Treponema sp.]